MFLKDTWRAIQKDYSKEGDVYDKLAKAAVPHVACVPAHGDLPGRWQTTCIGSLKHIDLINRHILERFPYRQHYRMVVDVVARRLTDFKRSKEVVIAIRDAILGKLTLLISGLVFHTVTAWLAALEQAKIDHRDISIGNIMIVEVDEEVSGILTDWERGVALDSPAACGTRRVVRTTKL